MILTQGLKNPSIFPLVRLSYRVITLWVATPEAWQSSLSRAYPAFVLQQGFLTYHSWPEWQSSAGGLFAMRNQGHVLPENCKFECQCTLNSQEYKRKGTNLGPQKLSLFDYEHKFPMNLSLNLASWTEGNIIQWISSSIHYGTYFIKCCKLVTYRSIS